MEIWPAGHRSPIHNHGGADAVIKVLHGEICVSLYRMLSRFHQQPFARMSFAAGEVTWITPRLNQTHMLRNETREACVTVQCYTYPESDTTTTRTSTTSSEPGLHSSRPDPTWNSWRSRRR
jgi:predicted metal-dependent enzyme (double-stranded beta helix superfamily)